jgi:heme-degrading monooxygenase HmoA
MEHIRVATYRLKGGATFTEIADAAKGGMLDTFRLEPGFRRYEVADIGDGELISVSLWESRQAAERGVALARDWVAANLADRIELVSNRVGDVAFTQS